MADGKVILEIVTPQGSQIREEVDDVTAPSVSGEFGVLPGHLPLLAALRTGIVTYHKGGEEKKLAVADGFVEVKDDRALLLTDKVTARDGIDPVKVRLELKEVDDILDHYTGTPGSPEWQELVAREVWAATQLELYGDPPPATQRPFEEFGPPAPPEEDEVDMPEPENDREASVEGRPVVKH
ncbi:MAG TPA: ATP synthase F1 subunit epsilon [Polyangiaceae bacterium]|nr:ATP synthase F1 subunit epsilon [Polyangiaceae bacterium]